MPEQNNKWRNKFNSTPLENEDWLEPSDKLFGAIEEEIYGEKKKRRILFPWLFLGLFIMSVVGYFTYSFFSNSTNTISSELTTAPSERLLESRSTTNQKESIKESTKEILSTNKKLTPLAEQAAETSLIKDPALQQKSKQQSAKDPSVTRSNPAPAALANQNSIFRPSNTSTKKYTATKATSLSGTNTSLATSLIAKKTESQLTAPFSSSPTKQQLAILAFLNSRPFQPLGQQGLSLRAASENILKGMNEKIDLLHQTTEPSSLLKNAFYMTGGLSQTQFKLNQNFSSAVNPADFIHNSDSGMTFGIGYNKGLTEKLGLFVELDYAKSVFTSGHNSSYTYPLATEQNESQQVNLTMATPLGFMEGSVLLLRTAAVTDPEVGLVLDLHNEHSYSTAGMNIGLAYELVSLGKVSVGVEAGLGIQKLFGLTNTLTEVTTSNAIFVATQTNILSDQSAVREWLPRSLFGISLQRALGTNSSIGLSYRYISGLQPIHSEGDLSTSMYEQRLQLSLLRTF